MPSYLVSFLVDDSINPNLDTPNKLWEKEIQFLAVITWLVATVVNVVKQMTIIISITLTF